MDQNTITPGTQGPAPRKSPHPVFLIAAASVAAVALIAGAQMLRSSDTAAAKNGAAVTNETPKAASTGTRPGAAPSTASSKTAKAPADATPAAQAAPPVCTTCGVVVAVREVRQAGEGTGVGAVAGGVVGGVVGHQFGGGRGKDAMTIAGAVGGAVAGHQIEKQARATSSWRVDVRMNDGTTRTFTYGTQPAFAAGEKVEVRGGQLTARG